MEAYDTCPQNWQKDFLQLLGDIAVLLMQDIYYTVFVKGYPRSKSAQDDCGPAARTNFHVSKTQFLSKIAN